MPAAIADAVPAVPFTEAGGAASPEELLPQQTTAPVPAWIAQLWWRATAIAVAVPLVPFTNDGGVALPSKLSPQQTTAPVPAWIAHLCVDTAIAEALMLGGSAPSPHPTTGPAPCAALAVSSADAKQIVTMITNQLSDADFNAMPRSIRARDALLS